MTTQGSGQSFDINKEMGAMRQRWGLPQSTYLTAALVLLAVAFVLGTIGHFLYLSADDLDGQANGDALYNIAIGAALAAGALMVLVRWQNGGAAGGARDDLRIAGALVGLAVAWLVLCIIFGFDKRLDAEFGWFRYAQIFAFMALAWCAVSRPVPTTVNGIPTVQAAIITLLVSAAIYVIGGFMSTSNSYSTFSTGVTLQDIGFVLVILVFAAFLGLAPGGQRAETM